MFSLFSHYRTLHRESPSVFYCLLILKALVTALMLQKLLAHKMVHAGLCFLTLLLYEIPLLLRLFRMYTPPLFQITVALFATAANICGEMFEFYLTIPLWDSMLHIIWGFLASIVGVAFFDILSRRNGAIFSFSPGFLLMLALSFAGLTSIVWELFEYGMDTFFATDMQKDCYLSVVNSLLLNPDGINVPVSEAIETVAVNGSIWNGYIDIGLHDTMTDILLNTIGSLFSSLFIYFGQRKSRSALMFRSLMPRPLQTRKDDKQ